VRTSHFVNTSRRNLFYERKKAKSGRDGFLSGVAGQKECPMKNRLSARDKKVCAADFSQTPKSKKRTR